MLKKVLFSMGIILIVVLAISCSEEKKTLEGIEEHFEEKGVEVTDKGEKAYTLIGANYGFSCYLNGKNVELYEFEEVTDRLEKAEKEGKFLEADALVNANIVMIIHDKLSATEKEAFLSY